MLQLRWSDEETWRDVRPVVRGDDETSILETARAEDQMLTKHYKHSFHGIFRIVDVAGSPTIEFPRRVDI